MIPEPTEKKNFQPSNIGGHSVADLLGSIRRRRRPLRLSVLKRLPTPKTQDGLVFSLTPRDGRKTLFSLQIHADGTEKYRQSAGQLRARPRTLVSIDLKRFFTTKFAATFPNLTICCKFARFFNFMLGTAKNNEPSRGENRQLSNFLRPAGKKTSPSVKFHARARVCLPRSRRGAKHAVVKPKSINFTTSRCFSENFQPKIRKMKILTYNFLTSKCIRGVKVGYPLKLNVSFACILKGMNLDIFAIFFG